MPRPKVDPKERRRVAKACNPCKTSKQKCNGGSPCALCIQRNRTASCVYSKQTGAQPPRDRGSRGPFSTRDKDVQTSTSPNSRVSSSKEKSRRSRRMQLPKARAEAETFKSVNSSDNDVEAPVPMSIRMLRDSQGKLMFIGDSAALSFLQTIRRLVQERIGRCEFSSDPLRHFMLERTLSPQKLDLEPPGYLVYSRAKGLVEVYFSSTSGLLDILDVSQFMKDLKDWIDGNFANNTPMSATFYLVIAVGAQVRAMNAIDNRLAKVYFDQGRQLACLGLMEDPSMPSIQSFVLMAFYMLGACRRNGAYLNLGTAVSASYAMGLHSRAANSALGTEEGVLRTRTWKSVRLLDLIISSTLGRPSLTCAHHSDINDDMYPQAHFNKALQVSILALDQSVRVFHIVEKIVNEVYKTKKVSLRAAEAISLQLCEWSTRLPRELREVTEAERESTSSSRGVILAKSNVAFSYYYAMMLLMRPFLIFHLKSRLKLGDNGFVIQGHNLGATAKIKKSAHACLDSAVYMLELMHKLLSKGTLFNNMTIMISWVFGAGLVVGLSFFDKMDHDNESKQGLNHAIDVCKHFAEQSPQAKRYQKILSAFRDACNKYHGNLRKDWSSEGAGIVSKILNLSTNTRVSSSRTQNTTRDLGGGFDRKGASARLDNLSSNNVQSSNPWMYLNEQPGAAIGDLAVSDSGSILDQDFIFTTLGDLVPLDNEDNSTGGANSVFGQGYDQLTQDTMGKRGLDLNDTLFGVHSGIDEQYLWQEGS